MRFISLKRGQSEIIGLLVIVILIIVIFGVYVSLSGGNDKEQLRNTKTMIELNNLLRSVMHYTICPDTDLQKALTNCLESEPETCGKDSCETAEKEFSRIIRAYEADQGWKLGYVLEKEGGEEVIFEKKISCSGDKKVGSITLRPNVGRYNLRLEKCTAQKAPK